jgi:peptide/nickel transport system substrate-binding protein
MAQVTYSLFKQIGLNVELLSMDWGSLLTRRASTKPPADGGWNCFNTRLSGLGAANPASAELRGNGLQAWFGWPTDPKLEILRED